MAAGWLRHIAGDDIDVFSAGSDPAAVIDEAAVGAMAEVGIDISGESPKLWTEQAARAADVIVSMGCADACLTLPGRSYLDWDLDDPSGQPPEVVREVRDEIRSRVEDLLLAQVEGYLKRRAAG